MPREIEPGLHWIYEPGVDLSKKFDLDTRRPDWYEPDRLVYIPQCAYLLEGEDETLLFDTLSPASTEEILAAIDDLGGNRGLDYLVVSHPDVPHAGNALAILQQTRQLDDLAIRPLALEKLNLVQRISQFGKVRSH